VQAAQVLATAIGERTAWLRPEIIKLGADKVHAFERQSPELARRFGFFLDNALRYASHTLSTEAEGVMAAADSVLHQPNVIYSQLANGELPVPTINLSDGSRSGWTPRTISDIARPPIVLIARRCSMHSGRVTALFRASSAPR
jgi:oligoendopeptidase F